MLTRHIIPDYAHFFIFKSRNLDFIDVYIKVSILEKGCSLKLMKSYNSLAM